MSRIKKMLSVFKNVVKATVNFIGYSMINIISATALLAGISGIFFTAAAVSNLAIAEAAYLAVETYVLMRIGKRVGLKLLDYFLDRSGLVDKFYKKPTADCFEVFKPKYKAYDEDDSTPTLSSGFSLDTSWNFGPFSISLPWAGYSKRIPLGFKDLKNYSKIGFNYLFNNLGLKDRAIEISSIKYAPEIAEANQKAEYEALIYSPKTEREIQMKCLQKEEKYLNFIKNAHADNLAKLKQVQNSKYQKSPEEKAALEKKIENIKHQISEKQNENKLKAEKLRMDQPQKYNQFLLESDTAQSATELQDSPPPGSLMAPLQHSNAKHTKDPRGKQHQKKPSI